MNISGYEITTKYLLFKAYASLTPITIEVLKDSIAVNWVQNIIWAWLFEYESNAIFKVIPEVEADSSSRTLIKGSF